MQTLAVNPDTVSVMNEMTNLQLEFQLKELQRRLATAEAQIAQQQKQIDELNWVNGSGNDDGPDSLPDWA